MVKIFLYKFVYKTPCNRFSEAFSRWKILSQNLWDTNCVTTYTDRANWEVVRFWISGIKKHDFHSSKSRIFITQYKFSANSWKNIILVCYGKYYFWEPEISDVLFRNFLSTKIKSEFDAATGLARIKYT